MKLFFTALFILLISIALVPFKTQHVEFASKDVQNNYLFAGDVVIDNQRVNIGTDLCAELAFNNIDSVNVQITKSLLGVILKVK